MIKKVLKDFETFEEFPNGYLCINNKSSYYFIMIGLKRYITKKQIDSVQVNENQNVIIEERFCDVKDGSSILRTRNIVSSKYNIIEYINCIEPIKVILLSSILKENETFYLSKKGIDCITRVNNKQLKPKNSKNKIYRLDRKNKM